MAFFLICVLSLILGRRVAWAMSRAFLYRKDAVLCALVCFTWANGLTFGLMYSVVSMHPGWFLKAIAFGIASYLSIPNYGPFDGNALPNELLLRNLYIKTATPLGLYHREPAPHPVPSIPVDAPRGSRFCAVCF